MRAVVVTLIGLFAAAACASEPSECSWRKCLSPGDFWNDATCVATGEVDPRNACQRCNKGKWQAIACSGPAEECRAWRCDVQAGCVSERRSGLCEDGDPCTEGEFCGTYGCVGGSPKVCSDGEPCTDDACGDAGCVHVDANLCTDGLPCTIDTCKDGVCSFAATCDDGKACTIDSCTASGCSYLTDCDDGLACTEDACEADGCVATSVCTDAKDCTTDSCTPGGCSFKDQCDDENPCTDDACGTSGCVHGFNTDPCDDDDACTVGDTCEDGVCLPDPVTICGQPQSPSRFASTVGISGTARTTSA